MKILYREPKQEPAYCSHVRENLDIPITRENIADVLKRRPELTANQLVASFMRCPEKRHYDRAERLMR
jgi:hypothetical protein